MLAMLAATIATLLQPQLPRSHYALAPFARASTVLCVDEPSSLSLVTKHAASAVEAALADDKAALSIEVFDEVDDALPTAVAMASAKAILAATTKPVLVLLPDLSTVGDAAREAVDWPAHLAERLSVATLAARGGPDDDMVETGAVVLCGLVIADEQIDLRRDALAWLRRASISLCINSQVPLLRFEADRYEPIFSVVPHRIQRELLRYEAMRYVGGFLSERLWVDAHPDAAVAPTRARATGTAARRPGAGRSGAVVGSAAQALPTQLVGTEEVGVVLIRRAYPGPWEVDLDVGFTGECAHSSQPPHLPLAHSD